jgi:hypothetical protein
MMFREPYALQFLANPSALILSVSCCFRSSRSFHTMKLNGRVSKCKFFRSSSRQHQKTSRPSPLANPASKYTPFLCSVKSATTNSESRSSAMIFSSMCRLSRILSTLLGSRPQSFKAGSIARHRQGPWFRRMTWQRSIYLGFLCCRWPEVFPTLLPRPTH